MYFSCALFIECESLTIPLLLYALLADTPDGSYEGPWVWTRQWTAQTAWRKRVSFECSTFSPTHDAIRRVTIPPDTHLTHDELVTVLHVLPPLAFSLIGGCNPNGDGILVHRES